MKNIYLFSFSVKGIKALDDWVRLSFYKKTVTKNINIQNYNIKGIYGANGSGKTAIITSFQILKEIIIDSGYLNNPLNQKQLEELINKKLGVLEYDVEYLAIVQNKVKVYRYQVSIVRDRLERFKIGGEKLSYRIATSHTDHTTDVYQVDNGAIVYLSEDNCFTELLREKTQNLLQFTSLASVAFEQIALSDLKSIVTGDLRIEIIFQYIFALSMFAYLEKDDEHTGFFIQKMLEHDEEETDFELYNMVKERLLHNLGGRLLNPNTTIIAKDELEAFNKQIDQLKEFLKIFKKDLQDITVDKREDKEYLYCTLLMHYQGYTINAEFESTGIRKLIKLFPYLQKMVYGDIVFIDELDSNLHDVYLCALLEYLREYGKGQLCFTSHNIGPMDVLKQSKLAIDFLSDDRKISSWVTNGNYSPSKLYRNGMIDGSPFNVDAIDFLGVFGEEGD